MPRSAPADPATRSALRLLARREHSALELRRKLHQRSFDRATIDATIEQLVANGWLSDSRFAGAYAYSRAVRGYGPLRIRAELRQRGVGAADIELGLEQLVDHWQDHLFNFALKRFALVTGVLEPAELQRQRQILHQRGFTSAQIDHWYRREQEQAAETPNR